MPTLDTLPLSVRARNVLHVKGVTTLEQLVALRPSSFLHVRQCGARTREEIQAALVAVGLSLAADPQRVKPGESRAAVAAREREARRAYVLGAIAEEVRLKITPDHAYISGRDTDAAEVEARMCIVREVVLDLERAQKRAERAAGKASK